jgi:hypothetical protein
MLAGVRSGIVSFATAAFLSGVCIVLGIAPDQWIAALFTAPPLWLTHPLTRVAALLLGGAAAVAAWRAFGRLKVAFRATAPLALPATTDPRTGLEWANLEDWDQIDHFSLWQAACLWGGWRPDIDTAVKFNAPAYPYFTMLLRAAEHEGLPLLKRFPTEMHHSQVSRRVLINLAALKGKKPAFLFQDIRVSNPPLSSARNTWRSGRRNLLFVAGASVVALVASGAIIVATRRDLEGEIAEWLRNHQYDVSPGTPLENEEFRFLVEMREPSPVPLHLFMLKKEQLLGIEAYIHFNEETQKQWNSFSDERQRETREAFESTFLPLSDAGLQYDVTMPENIRFDAFMPASKIDVPYTLLERMHFVRSAVRLAYKLMEKHFRGA